MNYRVLAGGYGGICCRFSSVVLVIVVLFFGCSMARAQTAAQRAAEIAAQNPSETATIYYYGWHTETRRRLYPEDVRRDAPVVVTVRDASQVAKIRHWLVLGALQAEECKEDVRLVVDLQIPNQAVESYYAGRFNLCSADSKRGRLIDEAFRKHFQMILEDR